MKDDQTSFRARGERSTRRDDRKSAARRRLPAALLTGAAIFLAGAVIFVGDFAGARGAFNLGSPTGFGSVFDAPTALPVAPERAVHEKRRHVARGVEVARGGGRAVCVRLCDGFFFPSVSSSGGDDACASQCPDAPTAFYSEPVGSDKIEDAVSLRGESYSALPVANHNRASFDNTCTCHRSFTRSYLAELLHDRTLRNGDVVMTAKGFTVFRSNKSSAVSLANFVALSQSADIPKNSRLELTAMERAGIWDRQSGPYSYSSAEAVISSVAAATTSGAPRPRKGIVTVDDGAATPPK